MSFECVPVAPACVDNSPGQNGNASEAEVLSHASQIKNAGIDFERNLFLSMGWPGPLIQELERQALDAGVDLIQAAIASGRLKASEFYGRLSRMLCFAADQAPCRVHLPGAPSKAWLLIERPLPLAAGDAPLIALNGQSFSLPRLIALSQRLGEKRRHLKLITRQELIDSVTRSYGRVLVGRAVAGLMKTRPEWSAKTGLAAWQTYTGAIVAGIVLGGFLSAPTQAAASGAVALSLFFLLAVALRFAALLSLLFPEPQKSEQRLLSDAELPCYTIFVPLFKEVAILPHLADALAKLDYPPAKLDIKLVLEAVDTATIEAATRLSFPGNVDLIAVPDREPRTKPKALNYALQFATGELAAIYDAEDRPEPDQLRKAATAFHHASPDVACLQARLDYFNPAENWLSRQFTIEYATLFRGILPLLSRFGLPLPLGGTSNHFRIGVLRKLGAWDPYNVTEDADLGMRLNRAGYRVQMLDSTTYEEACCQSLPWLKQRTRWLKGWMQTFGVHMRKPLATMRELGFAGFLSFQAYFAGIIVSSLAHPLFYGVLTYHATQGALFQNGQTLAERILLTVAIVNFIGGYAVNILLGAASLRGSEHKGLWPHSIFIPVYSLYCSAAAYRAIWQLFRAPFYWEKTAHGISRTLQPAKVR